MTKRTVTIYVQYQHIRGMNNAPFYKVTETCAVTQLSVLFYETCSMLRSYFNYVCRQEPCMKVPYVIQPSSIEIGSLQHILSTYRCQ